MKSLSRVRLCDPVDCSLPGSSVHGILQARVLEWVANREKMETLKDFIFLGSKITVDSDCSHEIKRCLFLGRKATTNLSSVAQSCPTLCGPMNRSTPGLPVHHQLPECTQTHIHRVRDAIQPSHPLSSPFPPAPNPSQHQSVFQ